MAVFTYQDVWIESDFSLKSLYQLEIENKLNQHATAYLKGILHSSAGVSDVEQRELRGSVVTVRSKAVDAPLFCGVVENVSVTSQDGIYYLEIWLLSGTYLLDQKPQSRSFQDISLTYQNVIDMVLADMPGANYIMTVGQDQPIGYPIIQYQETDWQFFQRLASHFGASLVPDVMTGQAKFWFGLPALNEQVSFSKTEYMAGLCGAYYEQGGKAVGMNRADYYYYDVESLADYGIGSPTTFDGKDLAVVEKKAVLRDGVMVFTYRLGRRSFLRCLKAYNPQISGRSIMGTVRETNGETVKIDLDIDAGRETGEAFPYPWTPITGNLMHLMPLVGTRVALYFYDQDERNAKAIHCERTNGGEASPDELFSQDYRHLNTEHDKRLGIAPEAMGLSSDGAISQMLLLEDESGVVIRTANQLALDAVGNITLNAPVITMQAKNDVYVAQVDADFKAAKAALDLKGDIDLAGQSTVYRGASQRSYAALSGSPVQEQTALSASAAVVLASVAVCLAASVVGRGISG